MATWDTQVNELFLQALAMPSSARQEFLAQACGEDSSLREQVESLLDASDQAGSFLERPVSTLESTGAFLGQSRQEHVSTENDLGPNNVIGPYKLIQQLGEGGMGTVFMAQQTEPVKRLVALKIIKPGMDSKQVIARFEAERQALALMDHPNIAKVLDAGTIGKGDVSILCKAPEGPSRQNRSVPFSSGRPYFVMELVKGVPITKYCDDHHLTPRQRLELFVPVCQAVQHAHQKGIIHRDLKPSNILVALYDGKPVPKVIDFGVAKAMGQQLTEQTLVTGFGTIVGTLEYMSPEQAEFNQLDIDTRSDIYSLGVVLYELLTGTTPLDRKRLKDSHFTELLRLIREQEPPKPSTRLNDSKDTLPSISAQRNLEPVKLTRLVRGELDWIVMKALEKDRSRRYATASGLALDVERYLQDEPLQACPPSAIYRLRKFARRNKVALITSGLVAAALLIGTAVSVWQAFEATNARQLADGRLESEKQARINEERQRKKAEISQQVADERRRQAEATANLLESVFKNLNPHAEQKDGPDLKGQLIARLDEAAAQLEREPTDLLTQARLQNALGMAYRGLGEANKAESQLQRSLETRKTKVGPDHPDTLTSMNNLALAYLENGKYGLALSLHKQTLQMRKATLGLENPDTVTSMHNLAMAYFFVGKLEQALPLLEKTIEKIKAKGGPDHHLAFLSMNALAAAYKAVGKLDQALPLFEQTVEKTKANLGLEHTTTLNCMKCLATAYREAGKFDQALPLLEQTMEKRIAKLGPDHPDTLDSMNSLGVAYHAAGKLDKAIPLQERTVEMRKAKIGPDHPATLQSMNNLAVMYLAAGKLEQALALHEQTLGKMKAKLGPDHPLTLHTGRCLATAYANAGKRDLALPMLEQMLEKMKAKLPPDDADTLSCMHSLGVTYGGASKFDQALPLLEQTMEKRIAKLGPGHPDTLDTMNSLAVAYTYAGKFDIALQLHERTLKIAKAKVGLDHAITLRSMYGVATAYHAASKFDLALPVYEQTLTLRKAKLGLDHRDTLLTMDQVASVFNALGHRDKAEPFLREVAERTKKKHGPESPATVTALVNLGVNLFYQKKFVQAEPPLRECLVVLEKMRPDAWTTFNGKSILGGALLGQKRYADAEPVLMAGYEGMKQREAMIPAKFKVRLAEAMERLVQLYDDWGQNDKADEWRKKLEDYRQAEKKAAKLKEK